MKTILLSFILIFWSLNSQSQVKNTLVWYTDLNVASELALEQNKPLMLFYTGSDWCGWCIKLQKEVFQTEEFKLWADSSVILLEVDFPRYKTQPSYIKEQNQMLQNQFGVYGYPTIWFVNVVKQDNKNVLAPIQKTGYLPGGPTKWITSANSLLKNILTNY